MNYVYGIFLLLSIPAFLTLLGFVITFFVGYIIKSIKVKKVGRVGAIISGSIFLAFIIITACSNVYLVHQDKVQQAEEKKMNKKFNTAASNFKVKYILTASTAEDVGNNETSAWMDGIDNSNGDDFDVDSTIGTVISDNQDDISSLSDNTSSLKNDLTKMKNNDTGKYDFDQYQKAYNKLQKLTSLVSSPYGSYNTFSENFSELDTDISSEYRSLTY